jgi:ubiquitin-like protein Pup
MTEREFRKASDPAADSAQEVILPTAKSSEFDVSNILDEIDLVLEENAEEFVKSFVQKGGQ